MNIRSFNVARLIILVVYHLVLIPTRNVVGSGFVGPNNPGVKLQHQTHNQRRIRRVTQQNASSSNNNDSSSPSPESTANTLREKADQLRREVTQFEDGKRDKERSDQLARDTLLEEKRDERLRYSAIIPILKGDGSTEMERVDFQPRIKASTLDGTASSSSVIMAVQAALPLGIILGEDETLPGAIRVDEVIEDGNGAASGVMVGDLLRACTACQVTMEMPTWQIMAGGIGRPKTSRMMFSTDGRPFEEVMEAVGSNRIDPEKRPAWLVLERNEESD
mmetsp:Transcript_36698/g.43855  ORF Transcript_36698/g.43855 Transcript_36698/m.43855 type:complete len:277 (-) Transcript_36698:235-1065(-)|eukprot:CAMPEP_0198258580 /NCGR_PEP_ID=MMETSP1447-20131203/7960_1 /TAXON_ID=420782 /ORGANISM="Chaetoceros dichaeta, Strain CCMP1751" /LENGTH=276 /DNA_ID=CAMNT_0043945731 /DNA_START=145 /DNA_END=978 /DNA_ORIENTATION=-